MYSDYSSLSNGSDRKARVWWHAVLVGLGQHTKTQSKEAMCM